MRLPNPLDVFLAELRYVRNAQCGRNDRCGSGRDAVGGEDVIVWRCVASESFQQFGTNSDRQLRTGHVGSAEGEDLLPVCCSEMHELVSQLVVVLQGMHQEDRLQPLLQRGVECEPQELRVASGQSMVVCGAVDVVVGKISTAFARI